MSLIQPMGFMGGIQLPATTGDMLSIHQPGVGITSTTTISTWADGSGNGYDLTVANARIAVASATEPLLGEDPRGRSCPSFDGNKDQLVSLYGATVAQPIIHAFAFKYNVHGSSTKQMITSATSGANQAIASRSGGGEWRWTAGNSHDTGVAADADWHFGVIGFNGIASIYWLDGTEIDNGNRGSTGLAGISLGGRYDGVYSTSGLVGFLCTEVNSTDIAADVAAWSAYGVADFL